MDDFDLVWQHYPRKTNKLAGRKAWTKAKPDPATVQRMIDALAWQTQTAQWQRGVIPHFSTWIHNARWEDERPGCACAPPPAPVVELAKSIARANLEEAERGRVELAQWTQRLIDHGMSADDAAFYANRDWLHAQKAKR